MASISRSEQQRLADARMRAEIAKLMARGGHVGIATLLVPTLASAALMTMTASLVKAFLV